MILISTHNIGFYEDLTKIIYELSSNTHLISSAGGLNVRLAFDGYVNILLEYRNHYYTYNHCTTVVFFDGSAASEDGDEKDYNSYCYA